MTDLHPEALIDRAAQGTLDPGDRARVRAHLAECASCRLELSVRRAAVVHTRVARDDGAMLERLAGAAIVRAAAPANEPAPRMSSTTGFALGVVAGIVLLLVLSAAVRFGRATMTDDEGPRSQAEAIGARNSAGGRAVARQPEDAPARSVDRPEDVPPPESPESAVTTTVGAVELPQPERPPRSPKTRRPEASTPEAPAPGTSEPEPEPLTPVPATLDAGELFSRATAASRRGEAASALAHFEALRQRFGDSREARTSWILSGRIRLARNEASEALRCFDRYLEGRGRAPLAPEAMAGRARALQALGRSADASKQWQAIVDRFPQSSAAAEARTELGLP